MAMWGHQAAFHRDVVTPAIVSAARVSDVQVGEAGETLMERTRRCSSLARVVGGCSSCAFMRRTAGPPVVENTGLDDLVGFGDMRGGPGKGLPWISACAYVQVPVLRIEITIALLRRPWR